MTATERHARLKFTVTMDVTPAQALALQAMFEYWNSLSRSGASRDVAFFCDGDGNFRPNCQIKTDKPLPELTEAIREKAVRSDRLGNRVYDFDSIAWMLHD